MKSHSGNAVKVYLWVSGLATAMFPFFAPENLGGGGNIRKKAEEEAQRSGKKYEEVVLEVSSSTY